MDRTPVSITVDQPVTAAAAKLLRGETNHLVVLDADGRLTGVITTFDISKAVLRPEKAKSVADVMTKRVVTTSADEPVDIAAQKLERNNISALPVVDGDRRVVGMLTGTNLSKLDREGAEMKLLVTFSRKRGREPVIAQVVRDTGVLINVERAQIDSHEGEALIEVPDESCQLVREHMEALGATTHRLDRTILYDRDECVDCGACISICPQDVFAFDPDWQLVVEEGRCVLCGKCQLACPHGALVAPALMLRERFHFRETHAALLAEEEAHLTAAKAAILRARAARSSAWPPATPSFSPRSSRTTRAEAGPVVLRMVRAADEAGVGPMAAVAGAIAAAGVEAMVAAGARFGVVENGGDIAYVDRPAPPGRRPRRLLAVLGPVRVRPPRPRRRARLLHLVRDGRAVGLVRRGRRRDRLRRRPGRGRRLGHEALQRPPARGPVGLRPARPGPGRGRLRRPRGRGGAVGDGPPGRSGRGSTPRSITAADSV